MSLKPTIAVAACNPPNCDMVAPSPIASGTTRIYAALQVPFSVDAQSPMLSLTSDETDEHLVASAAHCTRWRHIVYPALPREKQAMEMTEYGKHGKPSSRLPTLPTLFGDPFGITTFPLPRRLDICLLVPPQLKPSPPRGGCNGCLRSTT
jgi:hypothetical protein